MAEIEAIRQAFLRPEEELLGDWYDAQMRESFGRGAGDLLSGKGDLRDAFLTWLDTLSLPQALCRDWDYCAKRKSLQDPALLAAAIADVFLGLHGVPPPANVAVLMVKFGCDRLCKCDEQPA